MITPAFTQEQDAVAPEVPQQLEAVIAKLSEAIDKHDPAAVAALCTPAGIVTTPVGLFSGQKDIEKCYTGVFQRFELSDQVALTAIGQIGSFLPVVLHLVVGVH